MRDDMPEAALRLLTQLPVRVHERRPVRQPLGRPPDRKAPRGRTARQKRSMGVGRGSGQEQRVIINGRQYPSITGAQKALRIGHTRWMRMLDAGEITVLGRAKR